MAYRVELAPAAQRDLRRLSHQALELMATAMHVLAEDPRPRGVRKVLGQEDTWRIRVGPFRVIYDIYDSRNLVVVLRVLRRREDTYRQSL